MVILVWIAFILLVFALLFLDLAVFHKKLHEEHTKEALIWSVVWIGISLLFNVVIYFAYKNHWFNLGTHQFSSLGGDDAALKFFTGYILEKSLSIDNLFVIAMVFAYFDTPIKYQHEILFWGILGALISRGLMIISGAALLNHFSWITYIFGILLLFSAYKMLTSGDNTVDPGKNPVINFLKRFYPVTSELQDGKFFVKINGTHYLTPLFVVLMVIETSDAMFAVDSIPAVLAVTTDSFIVFTSNIFAILGLRSLYFVLASFMHKFHYLKLSLVFVLGFVGAKMLIVHFIKIPISISLAIIGGILLIGVITSIISNGKKPASSLSAVDLLNEQKKTNESDN